MSALLDQVKGGGPMRRSTRSIDEPRIIHGEAEGQAITLLYCTRANGGKIHVMPVQTETQVFRAGAAVVGCLLDSADDPVFVGMRVEMSHLTEWSGRSGLSQGIGGPHPDDGDESSVTSGRSLTVTLNVVPSDKVELPDEDIAAILLWSHPSAAAERTTPGYACIRSRNGRSTRCRLRSREVRLSSKTRSGQCRTCSLSRPKVRVQ